MKVLERTVAKRIGTRRTPLSGMNSGHDTSSDTLSKEFYVEAKYTANARSKFFPIWREVEKLPKKSMFVSFLGEEMAVFLTLNKNGIDPEYLDLDEHKKWKLWGIWNFFLKDVCVKASQEKKIPLVIIKVKSKRGELVLCRKRDYERVKEVFKWQN